MRFLGGHKALVVAGIVVTVALLEFHTLFLLDGSLRKDGRPQVLASQVVGGIVGQVSPQFIPCSVVELVKFLKNRLEQSLLAFRIQDMLFLVTLCDLLLQPRLLLGYLLFSESVLHVLYLGVQKLGFLFLELL